MSTPMIHAKKIDLVYLEESEVRVGDTISFDVAVDHEVRPGRKRKPAERHRAVVCELWVDEHPNVAKGRGFYAEVVEDDGTERRVWFARDLAEKVIPVVTRKPVTVNHSVSTGTYADTGKRMRFGTLAGLSLAHQPVEHLVGSAYRDVDVFRKMARIREELDAVERAYVASMRECGASWADVAESAGVKSKQAAQQKFGR